MSKASTIVARYGVSLERSKDDGSIATSRALPREDARALVGELTAAGIEASGAPDHDDRSRSWVYVTESA